MTVMVAIGRSTDGGGALGLHEWRMFKEEVKVQLWLAGYTLLAETEGHGTYEGEQEECAIFLAHLADPGRVGGRTEEEAHLSLMKLLAPLAPEYQQEAIAVVSGETIFCEVA